MKRPRRSYQEILYRDISYGACEEILQRAPVRRSKNCIEISHRGLVRRSCRELL